MHKVTQYKTGKASLYAQGAPGASRGGRGQGGGGGGRGPEQQVSGSGQGPRSSGQGRGPGRGGVLFGGGKLQDAKLWCSATYAALVAPAALR